QKGVQSPAYRHFDEAMMGTLEYIMADANIAAVYVPRIIELPPATQPDRGRFLLNFDNAIVHTPPDAKKELIEEAIHNGKLRNPSEQETFLFMSDIPPIVSAIGDRIEDDETLFLPQARTSFGQGVRYMHCLLNERDRLKEQYREQYGEAIKGHIIQMTRSLLASGVTLPSRYSKLGSSLFSKNVADLRTDLHDPGWKPALAKDYDKPIYLWYSWQNADLIAAPHIITADRHVGGGPDMGRAEHVPNRMWCLVHGLGDALGEVAKERGIFTFPDKEDMQRAARIFEIV
ncbi:MAG TPA: hypothetical protein VJL83_03960, partial [Patescibacteria group bacterium]|nr:hypothetical protein [Patescibacteria group bacterium]